MYYNTHNKIVSSLFRFKIQIPLRLLEKIGQIVYYHTLFEVKERNNLSRKIIEKIMVALKIIVLT